MLLPSSLRSVIRGFGLRERERERERGRERKRERESESANARAGCVKESERERARWRGARAPLLPSLRSVREFIDYETSMITDEDPG